MISKSTFHHPLLFCQDERLRRVEQLQRRRQGQSGLHCRPRPKRKCLPWKRGDHYELICPLLCPHRSRGLFFLYCVNYLLLLDAVRIFPRIYRQEVLSYFQATRKKVINLLIAIIWFYQPTKIDRLKELQHYHGRIYNFVKGVRTSDACEAGDFFFLHPFKSDRTPCAPLFRKKCWRGRYFVSLDF